MVKSAGFKPVPRSSDHIVAAPRADEPSAAAQASRPRPVSGLLRSSQVPLRGETVTRTGSPSPAGGQPHHGRQRLRPSGAPAGAALPLARPSAVPARPIQDVLRRSGQPLAAPLKEEMETRLGHDFSRVPVHSDQSRNIGARSPGQPLDARARGYFEPRFGHDFSGVRVHTDAAAAQSAEDVHAIAYTVGNDIVFGAGQFHTGPLAEWRVLAHELVHVVQQRGSGEPPGPAQEGEADAAVRAIGRGARPDVQARSGLGLAAQAKTDMASGAVLKGSDPAFPDVTTVTYAEIQARIERILKSPGAQAAQGRRDFSASPGIARANLYHTHFRDDNERLSYALGVFQASLGLNSGGIDRDELFRMLLHYEVQMQNQEVDVVVHTPPTKAEQQRVGEVHAEHERQAYEAYLAEVKRLNEEADKRTVAHGGYSGAATLGVYEYYVGEPVKAVAEAILQTDTRHMVSLMIDFVPIVGQVKTVAEAIIGRDLITGEDLPTWARGLNLLLAIIPEAKGIFSSGRAGLSTLARVAVDSGQSAEEVYQATRVASRLTEEEVQAAREVAAGGRATPAQRKLAVKLEEMPGETASSAAKAEPALAVKLEQVREPVRLAGKTHTLSIKRVGNQLRVWLCSNGCGTLIDKLEAMIKRLPEGTTARAELEGLLEQVQDEAAWIDFIPTDPDAKQRLKELGKAAEDIEERHPGAVNPDIPVAPTSAATAPEAASFEDVEPTGPLKPKEPRVRSIEDLPSKTSVAENFAKAELENSAWLKEQVPSADHRRLFMQWLLEGHNIGPHGHVTPYTQGGQRVLEQWASEAGIRLRLRRR